MIPKEFDVLFSGILRTLRRTLQACPELAGSEIVTSSVIASFLSGYRPDSLLTDLGGHGVAATYEGPTGSTGPTVLVRCELDAVAVERSDEGIARAAEETAPAGSRVAHRCGHDAHMTMVAALAPLLQIQRPERGRVVLLFQPAEETGEGARRVLEDPKFRSIRPDAALALHNLPGEPAGSVVSRRGHFACASVGMEVHLDGRASHAAEPDRAMTPGPVLRELLGRLPAMNRNGDHFRLLTVTHTRMGERSFGTTPGHAELLATLRAVRKRDLDDLRDEAVRCVEGLAADHGVRAEIEWRDEYPATKSDAALVSILENICEEEMIPLRRADAPFRWSEDFGHFGEVCPTLLFGLGIGETKPGLHQPDYEFPDDVLLAGVQLWSRLVRAVLAAY